MSRFQDPYLAESAGFATGHSSGIAQGVNIGRQQGHSAGYTEGWNAAAKEANHQLAKKDQLINKIDADREALTKYILELTDILKRLRESHTKAISSLDAIRSVKHEVENNNKSEYEKEHMALLGVAAIARSAMKIVSQLPANKKYEFLCHYQKSSFDFQTEDYIEKNSYPHNQYLIKQYLPDIHTMVNDGILPQVAEYEKKPKE